jgi:hypothetical protein
MGEDQGPSQEGQESPLSCAQQDGQLGVLGIVSEGNQVGTLHVLCEEHLQGARVLSPFYKWKHLPELELCSAIPGLFSVILILI